MPHEGYANPIMNDGPGFHLDMPVSELTEHDTQAIEANVVSSIPSIVEIMDGVMHETRPTPTEPNEARGLEPPDPNSGIQLTEVRRPTRKGLEATSRRPEPGEKNTDEPSSLRPTCLEANRVISTFSFNPDLEPSPQNLH